MFCRQCGKELALDSNFCDECGTNMASYSSTSAGLETGISGVSPEVETSGAEFTDIRSDMNQSTDEKALGLIPVLKKPKSFGRWDTYAMVITNRRSIFPQITSQMLKEAVVEAQRKGKEEGKGFFSRWADQLKATFKYSQRYWNMPPEDVLKETPGNFAIENADIEEIKVKRKEDCRDSEVASQTTTEIKINARSGKYAYNIDGHAGDEVATLKNAFGDRLKLSRW